jgi:hypothetical protein
MLRSIANVIFAFCLTGWILFALVLGTAIAKNGFGGVWPKLLHVLGFPNQLGDSAGRFVVRRLLELLLVTLLAAYARRAKKS